MGSYAAEKGLYNVRRFFGNLLPSGILLPIPFLNLSPHYFSYRLGFAVCGFLSGHASPPWQSVLVWPGLPHAGRVWRVHLCEHDGDSSHLVSGDLPRTTEETASVAGLGIVYCCVSSGPNPNGAGGVRLLKPHAILFYRSDALRENYLYCGLYI